MPKPINKTWGTCRCRVSGCDAAADIRRAKSHERGARYLVCPVHGVDRAHGAGPQGALDEWIDANQITAFDYPRMAPDDEAAPEPEPEPIPEIAGDLPEPQPMQEEIKPRRAVMIPPPPEPPRPGKLGGFFAWARRAHREFVGW